MTAAAESWVSKLRCPRCAGRCVDEPPTCTACRFTFPAYDGIPVVMARPHELVDQWRFRLAEFETINESLRARMIADAATQTLHPTTRARLERHAEGMLIHRGLVVGLFAEAGITPAKRTAPEPDGVPGEGSTSSYFHQIHRDWGWDADGSTENRDALAAVSAVLGSAPRLGAMLVLGAGACRLAADLHRFGAASLTVAVDINPLPMIVSRRVLAGLRVRLMEVPVAPPDLAHVAVDRQLFAADGPTTGFVHLFADALVLPFADASFDTVLTPWFIDQVPRDLATLLPQIRRVLVPGGRWINHGPLIYNPAYTGVAARYAADEVLAIAPTAGLHIEQHRADRLTYLQSPACTRGRRETVLSFVARAGDVEGTSAAPDEPAWLGQPSLAVPRFEGIDGYRAPHPLFTTVVALVDGARSTEQIAAILVRDYSLPPAVATAGVTSCLREIWRATRGA